MRFFVQNRKSGIKNIFLPLLILSLVLLLAITGVAIKKIRNITTESSKKIAYDIQSNNFTKPTDKNLLSREVLQASGVSCPIDPTGKIMVNFSGDVLNNLNREVGPVATTIPAGNYNVILASYDNHSTQEEEEEQNQTRETWHAKLKNSSGTDLVVTNIVSDIPDDEDWVIEQVNTNFSVPGGVTQVTAELDPPGPYGERSVYPICAAFDTVAIPTPTPTPIPTYTISGRVFVDTNRNGVQDGGETGYVGATVSTASLSTSTAALGDYTFSGLTAGPYTVTLTVPPGYMATAGSSRNVTLGPNRTGVNFGIVRVYSISGSVFNDLNKNSLRDATDRDYTGGITITSTGGTVSINNSNGTFTVNNLLPGTYTVSYTSSLPSGFFMIYPRNGPPPSFFVRVGPGCTTDTTTGASCVSNNIINLNFAISDSWPWLQTYGLDQRFDNGVTNRLPASTTCGGGSYMSGTTGSFTSPGIVFSGDGSANFGQGSASNRNWVVGGITYPEVFRSTAPLKTSTDNLRAAAAKAGTPITSLNSFGPCRNPATRCNLQGIQKGFYYTTGNIVIDRNANFNNGNYVVVADGNITIRNGALLSVTTGSTFLLAAGGDIIIDPSIRPSSNTCPVPAGQLQGIFSADRHITIQGNNGNCSLGADTMLNIDGVLIANAERIGGELQNQRDLCGGNPQYPSLTVKARPDFILNTPGFLLQQQVVSQEAIP